MAEKMTDAELLQIIQQLPTETVHRDSVPLSEFGLQLCDERLPAQMV